MNKALKIALISPEGWNLKSIRDELARASVRADREFHRLDEIAKSLRPGEFSILILRFEFFTRNTLSQLSRLRSLESDAGFITVATYIDPSLRFEARSLQRHILIEDPLELKDIGSSIEVLNENFRSRARMHPRTSRAEEVSICFSDGSSKSVGYFVDFAQMGARVVIDGKLGLKESQSVTVEYRSSSDRSKIHRIHSKVAWMKACKSNHTLMGVRFIASL